MKQAVEVWGKSEWNERIGQCIYDNAASITRGMKMGIIKYGFVDDAVYWNVSAEDEVSYQKVFESCQEKASNRLLTVEPATIFHRTAGGVLILTEALVTVIFW